MFLGSGFVCCKIISGSLRSFLLFFPCIFSASKQCIGVLVGDVFLFQWLTFVNYANQGVFESSIKSSFFLFFLDN